MKIVSHLKSFHLKGCFFYCFKKYNNLCYLSLHHDLNSLYIVPAKVFVYFIMCSSKKENNHVITVYIQILGKE